MTPVVASAMHEGRRARCGRRRRPSSSGSSGSAAGRRSRRSRRRTRSRSRASVGPTPGPLPSVAWRNSSAAAQHDGRDREQEGVARGRRAIEAEQQPARDRRARARDAGNQRAGLREADQDAVAHASATRCRGCASRRARRTAAGGRARSAPRRSARGCGRPSRPGAGTRARRCRSGSCRRGRTSRGASRACWRISGLRSPRTQATRMRAMSARK